MKLVALQVQVVRKSGFQLQVLGWGGGGAKEQWRSWVQGVTGERMGDAGCLLTSADVSVSGVKLKMSAVAGPKLRRL